MLILSTLPLGDLASARRLLKLQQQNSDRAPVLAHVELHGFIANFVAIEFIPHAHRR